MKKIINKLSFILVGMVILTSCEGNDIPTIDVDSARAIASFNGVENPKMIFNPAEATETTFRVGVSTLSDQDRNVFINVSEESTLDPSFYSISNLNPVIPAGEFTTEFTVTTMPGETLPSASSELILTLESIEGAEILAGSIEELNIGLEVKCPSVDLSQIPGTYDVTASTFASFFGESDFDREIVAGPGENQFTVVGGAYIAEGAEDLIFTVDPQTGSIVAIDETKIASTKSFGPNPYKFLPGGRVLTCAGIVELKFDFGGNIQGNPNTFNLIKQ